MSTTFVIADTHFGHRLMVPERGFTSIEEHDEALIERWNRVVTTKDVVWHLGDVLFGPHRFALLKRLKGTKKLIMGNHDRYPMHYYMEHFTKIHGAAQLGECIFTHIPVAKYQSYRFKANVHGHMHDKKLPDTWYVCVSAEQQDLTPRPLDDILKEIDWHRCGMEQ